MSNFFTKKNTVFIVSVFVLLAVIIWGAIFPNSFQSAVTNAQTFIMKYFSSYYILLMSSFIVFSLVLLLPKFGRTKLGTDDSTPEYSNISWFAMLFSAGMGIGLIFYGVGEPLYHYINGGLGVTGGSEEAVNFAMQKSFLHWGLHPWAGYVVIGGSLAYLQFRKGKPGLISSLLIPIFGENIAKGFIGKLVDIIAIFATVAGITTSLGLGAKQINSGLNYLVGIPENNLVVFIIVVITTGLFILSAVSGLDKGIKLLSNTNIALAVAILVMTLIVGPTIIMFKNLGVGVIEYGKNLIPDMLPLGMDKGETKSWLGDWTVFYWAWWIAWAPFVGSFIARISKGRTIREFVIGVLLAPVLASFVWFTVFGTAGIELDAGIAADASSKIETAIFVTLDHYAFGAVISGIVVLLLCTFFVTSADSGTFVLGMFSSNGDLNPSKKRKVLWGVIITSFTLVLLFTSQSGLENVQTASLVAALPFSIIMILAMVSWLVAMIKDSKNK